MMTWEDLAEEVALELEFMQFLFEWSRLREGILHVTDVFQRFREVVERYLQETKPTAGSSHPL